MSDGIGGPVQVLAGDIGGTKTLLQVAEFAHDGAPTGRVLKEARYLSGDYPDLLPMVREFLAGEELRPRAACFGVAGPVLGDRLHQHATLTNLPWMLDSVQLTRELGLLAVRLINDFQAVGYAVEALGPEDLTTLQTGEPTPGGPRVVLGAGTGLGVALLFPYGLHYEVYPTEGGHGDFAPTDDDQTALLEFLRGEFGRVSHERVISGPGLEAIYRFMLDRAGRAAADDPLLAGDDAPAAIAREAAQPDALAARALTLFVRAYGTLAGNLGLTCLAGGGVYLAGGIAPKLLDRLQEGDFLAAFNEKGRMSHLTRRMPVHVITTPRAGLIGAALAASRL